MRVVTIPQTIISIIFYIRQMTTEKLQQQPQKNKAKAVQNTSGGNLAIWVSDIADNKAVDVFHNKCPQRSLRI